LYSSDEIEDKFWKRFKGSIDLGVSLSKANSYFQFSIDDNIDKNSLIKGDVSTLNSS